MASCHRTAAAGAGKRHAIQTARTTKPRVRALSDLRDVLGHFSDALAVLETVARALDAERATWSRRRSALGYQRSARPSALSEPFTTNSIH
jgi:hypothetical protein